jgi:hypothetical protein
MGNIDLSPLMNSQPELYAIFLLIAYIGRKAYPLLKQNIVLKQSTLDCLIRIEQGIRENGKETKDAIAQIVATLNTVATKDDVIYSLKERLETPIVSLDSISKQAV